MYIPGRLRTASRPLSTLMLLAPYSSAPFGSSILSFIYYVACRSSNTHGHDHVAVIAAVRKCHEHAAVGVAKGAMDPLASHVVQHIEQISDVEPHVERLSRVVDFELFLRFFLLIV